MTMMQDEDHGADGFQRCVRYIDGEPYWFARDRKYDSPFSVLPVSYSVLCEVGTPGSPAHFTFRLPDGSHELLELSEFEALVDGYLSENKERVKFPAPPAGTEG